MTTNTEATTALTATAEQMTQVITDALVADRVMEEDLQRLRGYYAISGADPSEADAARIRELLRGQIAVLEVAVAEARDAEPVLEALLPLRDDVEVRRVGRLLWQAVKDAEAVAL